MSIAAFFSRMGMKSKFFIVTTCAIIAAMSIAGYLMVEREKDLLYAEAEKQGRLLGETLAIPITNDLIYERLGLVEEGGLLDDYIQEMFKRKDLSLLYIAVLDDDGKVISHNDIREYGKVYSDPLTRKALAADRTIVQHFSAGGHDALDIGVPLSIGKKRWGTLKFGISLEGAEHEILATIRKIVLMTAVFLLAGFAIIMLLSQRFISPILHLSNTMEKARGDYLDLEVAVRGHDELAVLGESFNSMISRIRQANEELRKTHEKMVQSEKLASVGVLAAGVAHEINNPLGGIFNCIQMLRQNSGDAGFRQKYLGLVDEGLNRIENTVSKLLWMSRKEEHKPVDVNIRGAVDSVYSFLEYKMKKGGITFKNGVPGNLRFTNGMALAKMAGPLKKAGLDRVNISMDTMKTDRYRLMTRGGELGRVWEGVEEAERARIYPLKINVVPIRGMNDDEVTDFARLTMEKDWHIRFIELMPVDHCGKWSSEARVKKAELVEKISGVGKFDLFEFRGRGPSRNYRLEGAKGVIGFISPISECFCQWCNRLRLTAQGRIRPCLFSDNEIDIRTPMRSGASDEKLDQLFRQAVRLKPDGHRLRENDSACLPAMSAIGG